MAEVDHIKAAAVKGEKLFILGDETVERAWLIKRRWWELWKPTHYMVGYVETIPRR